MRLARSWGYLFYLIRSNYVSNNIYKSTTNKVIFKYFLHKVLIISNIGVVACGMKMSKRALTEAGFKRSVVS